MMEFIVEDIGKAIKVDVKEFEVIEFAESFIPSFCVMVYKYQGAEIDKHYVFDVERMDKKKKIIQHCEEQPN